MPFLKAVVDTLDDVEEGAREFYKQVTVKDSLGKAKQQFEVVLEGAADATLSWVMPLRNAHDRTKADLATAKARVAELEGKPEVPDDFSADEWTRLKAVDAESKKGDDPERKRAHEAEVQSIKAMQEQALTRQKTKYEKDLVDEKTAHDKTKASLRTRVVRDDLTKALVESGVDKKFLKGARALLEQSIKVKGDGGEMQAFVETDLGETPIADFVPQWAQSEEGKLYMTQAKGSDAGGSDLRGSGKGGGNLDANPYAKATWNTTIQAQTWKADAAKAERLAKAAGHAGPLAARFEHAK